LCSGCLVPPWSTIPQAPLRSRTVGFPESGSGLGSARHFSETALPGPGRFKSLAHIRPTTLQFCCLLVPTLPRTASQLCVWGPLEVIRTTECPEPLCLGWALPTSQGDSKVTSEGVTPLSQLLRAHASDHGPPRASVIPWSWGLCRLSRVPAGPWPFPTLSLPSLWRCLDPYPAVFVRCTYPFLPQRQRPHVTRNTFGTRENPCKATSTGSAVSGLQSFADVQAPPLARPPDRSHRSPQTGRPGRLHHASPEGLPASGCGIATCLIWAIDIAGLAPARWQPCRLLLPALRFPARFMPRVMRPLVLGVLSAVGVVPGSC